MDIHQKVQTLEKASVWECEGPPRLTREARQAQFIEHSRVTVTHPQRGKIPVMRIMQTSACERNCHYCPFQAGRNYQRVTLKPEELASAFDKMQQKKQVDGLFLSSGIIGGGAKAMDKMLDTVDIIRRKHQYGGYVHLKIMPGAETAQIEQAIRLADRLSINLEGANEQRLPLLAPKKNFAQELLSPMYWVHQRRATLEPWIRAPSVTTQFVVGPAQESDKELLVTADKLYREAGLARAYYSAFAPIRKTTFEHKSKTDPLREHRLYQADWLLRFYNFTLAELPFDDQGNLSLKRDPKLVWAEANLRHQPLEINRATRSELLRIPGIGPKTADTIIQARETDLLRDKQQLRKIGVQIDRAAPFMLLAGRRPDFQLSLPGF